MYSFSLSSAEVTRPAVLLSRSPRDGFWYFLTPAAMEVVIEPTRSIHRKVSTVVESFSGWRSKARAELARFDRSVMQGLVLRDVSVGGAVLDPFLRAHLGKNFHDVIGAGAQPFGHLDDFPAGDRTGFLSRQNENASKQEYRK